MIMNTDTYNGWVNAATWNAHLWLTHEHLGQLRASRIVASRGGLETAAHELERWCRIHWVARTPDGYDLDLVAWTHIAEALRS
jgi:hypothetical protein